MIRMMMMFNTKCYCTGNTIHSSPAGHDSGYRNACLSPGSVFYFEKGGEVL